jgi:peptidyl-prolyl cis-trans isomerase B (cyclophilin B)
MSSIRPHVMWFLYLALAVLVLLFLVDNSRAFFENARHRTFSKQEIQRMEQTTATIETKFGEITLKFFPEVAPNHVNNFIELARDGFYDGTIFHRIVPGFVIQGGDPNTKSNDRSRYGTGGPGYTLKAEFSKLPHKRGTLSMARAAHPDSAGSQFFICVTDTPFLDGEYTVFGEVVKGMDVVDKIVSQPKDQRDNPIDRVEMKVKIAEPEDKP